MSFVSKKFLTVQRNKRAVKQQQMSVAEKRELDKVRFAYHCCLDKELRAKLSVKYYKLIDGV